MDSVSDKLMRLTSLLKKEVEVLELGRKIQSEAQGEMERMQRDFFLREQMKAIQKELGEEDEQAADIRELEERIAAAGMSEEAEKEARRELDRMRRMPIQAAEYSVIKTYLDLHGQPAVAGKARPTTWTSAMRARCWTKTTTA